MIKQLDFERGEELTAIEKYELQKEQSKKFIDYMITNGMEVVEDISRKKKKKTILQENFYIRDNGRIYCVNYCSRDLVFCKDLISNEQTAIKQKANFECSNSMIELLKKDDLLYLKLENGIVRKFTFYKSTETKDHRFKFTAIDILDGEALMFDEWQIHKILDLKG